MQSSALIRTGTQRWQRRDKTHSGWQTIRRVVPYLWPDGETWVKRRVVLALVALFAAKVFSLITPFFYKAAVDCAGGRSA